MLMIGPRVGFCGERAFDIWFDTDAPDAALTMVSGHGKKPVSLLELVAENVTVKVPVSARVGLQLNVPLAWAPGVTVIPVTVGSPDSPLDVARNETLQPPMSSGRGCHVNMPLVLVAFTRNTASFPAGS
jgi:hypothetical protein